MSVVVLSDEREVKNWFREVLVEMGIVGSVAAPVVAKAPIQHELMHTRTVKKALKEKGYMVVADPAFKRVLEENGGIKPVKRGKDNWYKRSDIERIPPKR